MIIYRLHFVYIILLLVNFSSGQKTFVTRAALDIHQIAVHHTHNLARDLRIAFGGYFIRRANNKRVVYCKRAEQLPLVNGGPSDGGPADGGPVDGGPANVSSSKSHSTATRYSSTLKPTSTQSSSTPKPTPTSPWKLSNSYQGSHFFDAWNFFTGSDPTNGFVNYVDEQTAWSSGLVEINNQGNAVMRLDTTEVVSGNRQSVRIFTQSSFNGGLFIMDSVHMPTGCGIWPAFWTNGPNWPIGGEIDIVEGVNDYTNNQATIHTDVGCTLPSSSSQTLGISGNVVGGTDCAAYTTGNQGCGIRASSSNSFGASFNDNGGGVYAMKWDTSGIAVYFFPRDSVPADISENAPQPNSWGRALARWPASSCAPFKFFRDHTAIFDTTVCGDWAGTVWGNTGIPGQEQSCAQRTGFATCQAFVQSKGSALSEGYWEVKSVKIYQLQN